MQQKRTKFQVRSDASKQRWVRDDKKEAYWRKHIQGWKASGLSKRAYCIDNNLSQSSFNAWTREIGIRDREKLPSANASALLSDCEENPFVPLRIVHDEEKPEPAYGGTSATAKQHVDILVPGGAVIRVDENCNVNFIASLFSTLKG
jgi:hypothetical protein